MNLALTLALVALLSYGMYRALRFGFGPPPVPRTYRPAKPLPLKRPRATADRLACRNIDWKGEP